MKLGPPAGPPPDFSTVTATRRLEQPGQPGSGSPNEAVRDMLDRAHRYLTDLGYPIADCALFKHATIARRDDGDHAVFTYGIHVRGARCFEVEVDVSPWRDYASTEVTTPRVIAWPEAVP